jgi:catechol 2,3-dioxygenase-like lactoylglutathione lyase family enzyme
MANDAILLDHLALAVRDVREVLPFLVGELGGREDLAGPGMGFRFWQWAFAGGGRIEIIQPEGPTDGFLYRFLDARGPGPHHLTFKVPDLHDAAKRSGELGYDVVGLDTSQPAWMEAFLHPKQAQGIVVQLVESHPELGELDQGDWPFPFPRTANAVRACSGRSSSGAPARPTVRSSCSVGPSRRYAWSCRWIPGRPKDPARWRSRRIGPCRCPRGPIRFSACRSLRSGAEPPIGVGRRGPARASRCSLVLPFAAIAV